MPRPRQPRFRRRLPVIFRADGTTTETGYTLNVGPGGLALQARRTCEVGARVQIALTTDSGGVFTMTGVVSWVKRTAVLDLGAMGVQLDTVPDAFKQVVAEAARAASAAPAMKRAA